MKTNETLESLFLSELADIYYAELHILKALPKMIEAATHDDLRSALQSHLEETVEHVAKVETVFEAFGKPARKSKCDAIEGILKEGTRLLADNKGSITINAAVIAACQKVEHYEMASYGCLREWAEQLGRDRASALLDSILDEEKSADQKLTDVARIHCNAEAERASTPE